MINSIILTIQPHVTIGTFLFWFVLIVFGIAFLGTTLLQGASKLPSETNTKPMHIILEEGELLIVDSKVALAANKKVYPPEDDTIPDGEDETPLQEGHPI